MIRTFYIDIYEKSALLQFCCTFLLIDHCLLSIVQGVLKNVLLVFFLGVMWRGESLAKPVAAIWQKSSSQAASMTLQVTNLIVVVATFTRCLTVGSPDHPFVFRDVHNHFPALSFKVASLIGVGYSQYGRS